MSTGKSKPHFYYSIQLTHHRLDFTMCNPPFYASRDELIASAEAKERPPFTVIPILSPLLSLANINRPAPAPK